MAGAKRRYRVLAFVAGHGGQFAADRTDCGRAAQATIAGAVEGGVFDVKVLPAQGGNCRTGRHMCCLVIGMPRIAVRTQADYAIDTVLGGQRGNMFG